MNTLELSSKEIIYIASLCDADVFYGIPDGFYGMETAEIAVEINKIKVNLTNKGYAEMNFDGDFVVSEEVMKIISDCVLCDKYISFDKTCMQKKQFMRCYLKEDKSYLLMGNDDYYVIERVPMFNTKDKLLSFINWIESTTEADEESIIKNELLYELKSMSEFDNPENKLKATGCNATNAKIICDGLLGNATYYSFSVIDNSGQAEEVNNLSFINSTSGSLYINSLADNEDNLIKFLPIFHEQIIEVISSMLRKIDCDVEAKFT